MTCLLAFEQVQNERTGTLNFCVNEGDLALLELPNKDARAIALDLAVGEVLPDAGTVRLQGVPVQERDPLSIGLIASNGGLISNLKVWENVTLPLWYYSVRNKQDTELALKKWISLLLPDEQDWERFMGSPVARLRTSERKLAGLLRALVQSPKLILVDAGLFDEADEAKTSLWRGTLEAWVAEDRSRAVLVVANVPIRLNWKKIAQL